MRPVFVDFFKNGVISWVDSDLFPAPVSKKINFDVFRASEISCDPHWSCFDFWEYPAAASLCTPGDKKYFNAAINANTTLRAANIISKCFRNFSTAVNRHS